MDKSLNSLEKRGQSVSVSDAGRSKREGARRAHTWIRFRYVFCLSRMTRNEWRCRQDTDKRMTDWQLEKERSKREREESEMKREREE